MNTKPIKHTNQSKSLSNNDREMASTDRRLFDLRWQRSLDELMDPLMRINGKNPRFAAMHSDTKRMMLNHYAELHPDGAGHIGDIPSVLKVTRCVCRNRNTGG